MKGWSPLSELIGNAEPVAPEDFRYTTAPAWKIVNAKNPERACHACLFEGQRAAVCNRANELAAKAGLPACETLDAETGRTVIYVLASVDKRQLTIE